MKNIPTPSHEESRCIVLVLAVVAFGLGLMAVTLANLLQLDACHLCIFQRVVFFAVGATLSIACLGWKKAFLRQASLITTVALCVWGMIVAAQQSWYQWFGDSTFSCTLSEPDLSERVIDWLGNLFPMFFMATGSCGSKDLVILGLSLANWSFLFSLAFITVCLRLLLESRRMTAPGTRPSRVRRHIEEALSDIAGRR